MGENCAALIARLALCESRFNQRVLYWVVRKILSLNFGYHISRTVSPRDESYVSKSRAIQATQDGYGTVRDAGEGEKFGDAFFPFLDLFSYRNETRRARDFYLEPKERQFLWISKTKNKTWGVMGKICADIYRMKAPVLKRSIYRTLGILGKNRKFRNGI